MSEWLKATFGETTGQILLIVAALAIVLLLLAVLVRAWRSLGPTALGRGGQSRLSVVEAAAVDTKRRLVLVRRDNVEHLVMIGGMSDVLIEQGIEMKQDSQDQQTTRRAKASSAATLSAATTLPPSQNSIPPAETFVPAPSRTTPPLQPKASFESEEITDFTKPALKQSESPEQPATAPSSAKQSAASLSALDFRKRLADAKANLQKSVSKPKSADAIPATPSMPQPPQPAKNGASDLAPEPKPSLPPVPQIARLSNTPAPAPQQPIKPADNALPKPPPLPASGDSAKVRSEIDRLLDQIAGDAKG
ncbi:MAG: hypothetical protein AAFW47_03490 [Pseudomonadota bacterium]